MHRFDDRTAWRADPSAVILFGLVCLTALAAGCTGNRAMLQQAALDETRRRADAVVLEARAEVAALRAEVAATRIAAAKKEAELRELRREVVQLRAAQAKLNVLRTERDRLAEDKAVLEARLSGSSARSGTTQPRVVGETKQRQPTVQARVKALEASVTALTTRLTQIAQDPTGSARPRPREQAESGVRITVKWGDTLWDLARTHGVSIRGLRNANGLTGDLIVVGQRLRIPRATAPLP